MKVIGKTRNNKPVFDEIDASKTAIYGNFTSGDHYDAACIWSYKARDHVGIENRQWHLSKSGIDIRDILTNLERLRERGQFLCSNTKIDIL